MEVCPYLDSTPHAFYACFAPQGPGCYVPFTPPPPNEKKAHLAPEPLRSIASIGSAIKVWTHLHVRETDMELYGFSAYAEMQFFEVLIGISGIGPKSALGILGIAPLDTLKRAIAAGESAYLTKVSGFGKRMAEKIIVELRDKLGGANMPEGVRTELAADADVLDALIAM